MTAIALAAEGLAKRYSRRRPFALVDIDLEIPKGGVTALVGPNAAGKSTLIRSWAGFERPTRGRALIRGLDAWWSRSRALEHLAYVPQSPVLYDTLTVADHLRLAARARPRFDRPNAERRLDELGVPLNARASELSGGQQAQVSLAIALSTGADIVLMDEPLASLDPLARRDFLFLLRDAVASRELTVVLSSHIVSDIERTSDWLLVLGVGKVILHMPVKQAASTHAVRIDPTADGRPIGAFRDVDGSRVIVVAAPAATPGHRAATLEEVMLAHLASASGGDGGERDAH